MQVEGWHKSALYEHGCQNTENDYSKLAYFAPHYLLVQTAYFTQYK